MTDSETRGGGDDGLGPADATRDRPVTEASYGIPDDESGLLPWSFVADRLADQRTFWVATTLPDGGPHARPVWGVFVDGTFFCGGGTRTRWVRNLAVEPAVVVHSESGTEVVVVEGTADRYDEGDDPDLLARVDAAYDSKYGVEHGAPVFAVRPDRVLAWSDYPTDATRWTFE